MYLKSLTLKGFKSFASSTTLQLEPGITCIVGPNGSGKSNVVDALAWVMGEQGAKSLRGGKMEDVIFAGTSGRPPLGRAEVLLTIDNSDGALPIEYAEVTISRTMFRTGGSEYAINGSACRLLDVQELLSDSGIGREMHVIVGQGQLDTILHATPEDRRGFIEEAAGVLKHRKRKEKALRKLDATDGNLTRLSDLLDRDPPPAQAAGPSGRGGPPGGDRAGRRPRRPGPPDGRRPGHGAYGARAGAGRRDDPGRAARGGRGAAGVVPGAGGRPGGVPARGPAGPVASPGHLVRAVRPARAAARHPVTRRRAAAQRRRRPRANGPSPVATPSSSRPRPPRSGSRSRRSSTEAESHRTALEEAVTARRTAEEAAAEEERRVAGLVRAAADRREGLARLHGQVNALRTRAAAADDEIGRLRDAREEAVARAERAQRDFTAAGDEGRRPRRRRGGSRRRARGRAGAARRHDLAPGEDPRRGAARRPRAVGAGRPQGGPRAGPQPPRRCRGAAGGDRPGLRSAGLGGRAAVGAVRLRDGGRRGPGLGRGRRRRGRRRTPPWPPSTTSRPTTSAAPGWCSAADPTVPDRGSGRELPGQATYAVDAVDCPDDLRGALARLLLQGRRGRRPRRPRARWSPTLPDVTAVTRDGDLIGAFRRPAARARSRACWRSRRPSTRRPRSSPRPPR